MNFWVNYIFVKTTNSYYRHDNRVVLIKFTFFCDYSQYFPDNQILPKIYWQFIIFSFAGITDPKIPDYKETHQTKIVF